MIKILTVVGARPQFIKASVLSRTLASGTHGLSEVMVHTGQHTDMNMSGGFFQELNIPAPKHQVKLTSAAPLGRCGEMLAALETIVQEESPDAIMVYGDTDSTVAGAWVAARLNLKLIHVEAGLRSFDRGMPEEINRIATDHWATHLCCPTLYAVEQLAREGVQDGDVQRVAAVGDLQCAAALDAVKLRKQGRAAIAYLGQVVLTMHRPANVDDSGMLSSWFEAIYQTLEEYDLRAVFPIHPRTQNTCCGLWGETDWKDRLRQWRIDPVEPMGYLDLMRFVESAPLVLTDSGGLQKEAFVLQTGCLVLRPVTEWVELVEMGKVRCVKSPSDLAGEWLQIQNHLRAEHWPKNDVYSAVGAGERLAETLSQWLC